jgi:NADPH-dependent ferric siderophore reductase
LFVSFEVGSALAALGPNLKEQDPQEHELTWEKIPTVVPAVVRVTLDKNALREDDMMDSDDMTACFIDSAAAEYNKQSTMVKDDMDVIMIGIE